ncbi:hypothetical protein BDZ45DRAFT_112410 [Acephala macrosclerotiorum]|nr:hypothetical protein BDZ45DRAFT_112410 [Acephala macrosclerotiorum]
MPNTQHKYERKLFFYINQSHKKTIQMFRYTMTRILSRSARPSLPTITSRTTYNTTTLDAVKLAEVREEVHNTAEPELYIPNFAPNSKLPVSKIWRDIKRVNDAQAVAARAVEFREVHGKVRGFGYDFDMYTPGFMIKTAKPAGSPILNAVASLKEKITTNATASSTTQTRTIASSAAMGDLTDGLASRSQDQRTEAAMKNIEPLMKDNARLNSEEHVTAARKKVAKGIQAWKPNAKTQFAVEVATVKEDSTIDENVPTAEAAEVVAGAVAAVPATVKDRAANEDCCARQISSMASVTEMRMTANCAAISERVHFAVASGRSAADLDNAFL